MSFRHVSRVAYKPLCVTPVCLQRVDAVSERGFVTVSFVNRPVDCSALPKFSDYRLRSLLESGVPLQSVDPVYKDVSTSELVSRTESKLSDNNSDNN